MIGNKAIHAWVSGRVQGVFFRQTTKEVALRLGINGWVKNLPDGRVELVACGSGEAVDTLIRWLHRGPPRAKVQGVEVEEIPWESLQGFHVLR